MRGDQLQNLACPGAGAAGFVHAFQPHHEFFKLFGIEGIVVSAGNAIVFTDASKFDAPHSAVMSLFVKSPPEILCRGVPGTAGVSVGDSVRLNLADGVNLE
jgi:hypothetical protein